jgi:hypothetical protein
MTDAEALAIADVNGLWLFSTDEHGPERTLRAAIACALQQGEPMRLIRPGAIGERATWLEYDQILRLAVQLGLTRAAAA